MKKLSIFAAIYIYSGNILMAMILHATYDILMHAMDYMKFRDLEWYWSIAHQINELIYGMMFVSSIFLICRSRRFNLRKELRK